MKVPEIRIENAVSERLYQTDGHKYVDLDHLYLDADSGHLYACGVRHAVRCKVKLNPGDQSCCIKPSEIKNARREGIPINTEALKVKKAILQGNDVEYADLEPIKKLIEPEIDASIPPLVVDAAQLLDIAKALHKHTRGKKFFVALYQTKTGLGDKSKPVIFVEGYQDRGAWRSMKKTGQAIMIPVQIPDQ